MKWYFKVLRQYADFSGRARRKEYWMFVLFNAIFLFVASIIDIILAWMLDLWSPYTADYSTMRCYLTYSFAMMLPSLAVVIRRLHDIGKSGWWILISLIPLVGGIWLLVLMFRDSQKEDNRYGANPKISPCNPTAKARLRSLAITLTLAAIVGIINWMLTYFPFLFHGFGIMHNLFVIRFLIPSLLFLVIGILLFPHKSSGSMFITEVRQRAGIMMIIYAAIITIMPALRVIAASYPAVIYKISDWIHLILYLALLFFVIALYRSNRKTLRIASVFLMVMSGILIIWDIYFNSVNSYSFSLNWISNMNILLLLLPIYPVSLMLLAAVFMPRKTEDLEEVEQFGYSERSEQISFSKTSDGSEDLLSDNFALLHVYRQGAIKGFLISYNLHLGKEVVFRVKNKSKTTIKITNAGVQTLWAKTEVKKKLPINIQLGNEYYIRCSMKFGFFVGRPKLELVDNQTGKIEFERI
jgi:uncharacterized membrane protein YhaH (DUF805 family)